MSKSKGSDKKGSDKQYETIERKNISISVSAIGDPDVVGSLVANVSSCEVIYTFRLMRIVIVLKNIPTTSALQMVTSQVVEVRLQTCFS